jgi:hypothetical protein
VRATPIIYEINTSVWLDDLGRRYGRPLHLGNVPAEEWDGLASWGFDAVWLMGVWERSPAGRQVAREHAELLTEYRRALPGVTPDDVVGSPYAVHRYVVDAHFGGSDGLRRAREELARRNIALFLDFVPNHVAIDHPWTSEHPEYFIHEDDGTIAHGRDPYFPPWTDTAQINVFQAGARAEAIATLRSIATQCDGVRCDMAMLLLTDVFRKTWGDRAGPTRRDEYWSLAIPAVKSEFPDFTFMAEVYWDLEARMQELGFDYCYDKRLYDCLVHRTAESIREHLTADLSYQRKLVRLIENHDEPRAAAVFDSKKERAAAVVMSTLPGAALFHDGQFEGRRIKLPVQLGRRPEEPVDTGLQDFYRRLLHARREGEWQLLTAMGWPDNSCCENLLAWCWSGGDQRALIVVNYSRASAQGRIRLPWVDLGGKTWRLSDALTAEVFVRDGDEMVGPGLFVDLGAWRTHFLIVGN